MNNIKTKLAAIFKAARPIHWVKNLSLFAAIIFTGQLFVEFQFLRVFFAFIAFNFATSATYVFNDILDVKNDRMHPTKRFRPIASGKLPISLAWLEVVFLSSFALALALALSEVFFLLVGGYLLLQAAALRLLDKEL